MKGPILGLFTSNTTSDNSLRPFLRNLKNLTLPPLNYLINMPLKEVCPSGHSLRPLPPATPSIHPLIWPLDNYQIFVKDYMILVLVSRFSVGIHKKLQNVYRNLVTLRFAILSPNFLRKIRNFIHFLECP